MASLKLLLGSSIGEAGDEKKTSLLSRLMRERQEKTGFLRLLPLVIVLLCYGAIAEGTMVYFPATDIGGGIIGTAEAEVTSGAGYLDILLTNTSALGPELTAGQRANPFITEIEIAFASGLSLDEGSSYVSSLSDTLFAQGQGNAAVNYAVRNLYYNWTFAKIGF